MVKTVASILGVQAYALLWAHKKYSAKSCCIVNIIRGRPTLYNLQLQRPPALVIRDEKGFLVHGLVVDGGLGAAMEIKGELNLV